jgi:hypothetical protein
MRPFHAMNGRRAIAALLGCALVTALASSCGLSASGLHELTDATSSGSGGTPIPCSTKADCPGDDDPVCGQRSCDDGLCGGNFEALGADCGDGKVCDGVGLCVSCLSSQDCAEGTCVGGVQVGGATCTMGACVPVPKQLPCEPYECNEAKTHCLSACRGADTGCLPQHYCDSSGNCQEKKVPAVPCREAKECASGFCADGVCCDTACDRACESCVASLSQGEEGICTPTPATTDPEGDCRETLECSGAPECGTCGTTPTAPKNETSDACPMICDACNQNECIIDCAGGKCEGQSVECPEGWNCTVNCVDNDSCKASSIHCPEAYACRIDCNSGNHRCENAHIYCSAAGSCDVSCEGGDACKDATIHCGANLCKVTCLSGNPFLLDGCMPDDNLCNGCQITQCP